MGKGGHNICSKEHNSDNEETGQIESLKEQLINYPTLAEIKNAIPGDCFESEVSTSMYYVVKDALIVALLYFLMIKLEELTSFYWLFYPLYWYTQGTMYTAIFVLGHDCGHGSFSKYTLLNDIMGNLLHTFILAPYYPWKITHRKHHNNTSNIDKDEVFYPKRACETENCDKDGKSTLPLPPGFGLSIGWWFYLIKGYCPRHVNHFNPLDKFFKSHIFGCTVSIVLYALWCLTLLSYAYTYGFFALIAHHMIPVFIFSAYIVIITFLHHNDETLPWYANSEWNYVKGQLSTMDYDYGHVHSVIHNIGTHQIHHLFTLVPHYKLEKATQAFRNKFPQFTHYRPNASIMKEFFRMFNVYMKQYIIKEKDVKVFYYKKSD